MPELTPELKEVHARMTRRAHESARPGRWWMRQAMGKTEDDAKVITPEELAKIYERAEQKEKQ